MFRCQLLKHVFIGGILTCSSLLGFFDKLEVIKKHLSQLLGRGDIEVHACQLIDPLLEMSHLLKQLVRKLHHGIGIQANAFLFHGNEHRDQRHFHFVKQVFLTGIFQRLEKRLPQAPGDLRIFRSVFGQGGQIHLIHGFLILPLGPNQTFNGNGIII